MNIASVVEHLNEYKHVYDWNIFVDKKSKLIQLEAYSKSIAPRYKAQLLLTGTEEHELAVKLDNLTDGTQIKIQSLDTSKEVDGAILVGKVVADFQQIVDYVSRLEREAEKAFMTKFVEDIQLPVVEGKDPSVIPGEP